jgi:hypothetical protein
MQEPAAPAAPDPKAACDALMAAAESGDVDAARAALAAGADVAATKVSVRAAPPACLPACLHARTHARFIRTRRHRCQRR